MTGPNKGILYCIPSLLGGEDARFIPDVVKETVQQLDHFLVEHPKAARHFLRRIGYQKHFDHIQMTVLNKHTDVMEQLSMLQPLLNGHAVGLLSEAGAPGIADPGGDIIALAHEHGIPVVPLPGPSSILLTVMAAGLNGQSFTFNGYLPIDKKERQFTIKKMEQAAASGQTQLFMEAPYRNNKLLQDVLHTCAPTTRLCIAVNLTLPKGWVKTKTIQQWQQHTPDLHKQPAMFALGQ